MTNWLDYFKSQSKKRKELDLNKPVGVGEPMKDLRAPLPGPTQTPESRRSWDLYNLNERSRRWMTRERRA